MEDKDLKGKLILNASRTFTVSTMLITIIIGVLLATSIWFAYQCSYWRTRANVAEVQLIQIEKAPELYLKTYMLEKMNESLVDAFEGQKKTSNLMLDVLGLTEEEAIDDMKQRGYIQGDDSNP